jgi:hypothetical protein
MKLIQAVVGMVLYLLNIEPKNLYCPYVLFVIQYLCKIVLWWNLKHIVLLDLLNSQCEVLLIYANSALLFLFILILII